MGALFAQYGKVEVSGIISKAGIATGDMVIQVTLTCESFAGIPNILIYWEREWRWWKATDPTVGCVGPQGTSQKPAPGST